MSTWCTNSSSTTGSWKGSLGSLALLLLLIELLLLLLLILLRITGRLGVITGETEDGLGKTDGDDELGLAEGEEVGVGKEEGNVTGNDDTEADVGVVEDDKAGADGCVS